MLYIASETFACLFDGSGFVEDEPRSPGDTPYDVKGVNVCLDISNSNEAMLWLMCLGMFFKLIIVPNLARKYDNDNIMRFDLKNGREQVQMIMIAFTSIFAMFVFATSEELRDGDLVIMTEKTVFKRRAFRYASAAWCGAAWRSATQRDAT